MESHVGSEESKSRLQQDVSIAQFKAQQAALSDILQHMSKDSSTTNLALVEKLSELRMRFSGFEEAVRTLSAALL